MNVNVVQTDKNAVNSPEIYSKLTNCIIVSVNINLNVSSLTRILMVNHLTLNWVHAFEVPFTVIFT